MSKNENKPYYDLMVIDFKDHIAERKDNIIDFGIPNTGIERIRFMILPNTSILVVYGDLGYAMFNWYRNTITFEDISTMSIDYFQGKCVASEVGRDFRDWYPERAKESIGCEILERIDYINDQLEEKKEDQIDTYKEFIQFINDHFNFDSRFEFADTLTTFPFSFFDCDDYEAGFGIHPSCYLYLKALKLAMKYLTEHDH